MKKFNCINCGKLICWQTFYYGTKKCVQCANGNIDLNFVTKDWLIKEYFLKKKSMQQIAKELKCHRSLIRRRFETFKLKERTKSESKLGIKRKPFTFKTRLKMRNKKLGIKLTLKHRKNLAKARKNKNNKLYGNKYSIVKHHIDLNKRHNKDTNILKITRSIHSYIHNSAYEYLVRKKLTNQYIKWFFKYKIKEVENGRRK